MFWTLLGIAAALGFGVAVIAGGAKGISDAIKNNRNNTSDPVNEDTKVEPKKEPKKVKSKGKDETIEDEIKENVDDEVVEQVSQNTNGKISKEEWLKNNDLKPEELLKLCRQKVETLYPDASEDKKSVLTQALVNKCNSIVNRVKENSYENRNLDNLTIEGYINNKNQGEKVVLDKTAKKYDAYFQLYTSVKEQLKEYAKSRREIELDSINDLNDMLSDAKEQIFNIDESVQTYINGIKDKTREFSHTNRDVKESKRKDTSIQNLFKKASSLEDKIGVLNLLVDTHTSDIKDLLAMKDQIMDIKLSNEQISEDQKNKMKEFEENINKAIDDKIKEIKTKIANVAKTKVNSSTLNSKLSKIEKALSGKASQEEVEKVLELVEGLKAAETENSENGLTKEDLENIKTMVVEQAINLVVPQVMQLVTDKIIVKDKKARTKIVKETIEAIREEISVEVGKIDLDGVVNSVIDKIAVVNKDKPVKK